MENKKKPNCDITVHYNDGEFDVFHNPISSSCKDGILIIEEGNNRFVHIVVANITYWVIEEV